MANKMTVKELIRKLQKYPDDMKVYISTDGNFCRPANFDINTDSNELFISSEVD